MSFRLVSNMLAVLNLLMPTATANPQISYNPQCIKEIRKRGLPRVWWTDDEMHPLIIREIVAVPNSLNVPATPEIPIDIVIKMEFESTPMLSCLQPESTQLLKIIRQHYLHFPDGQPYNLSIPADEYIRKPELSPRIAREVEDLIFKGKLKNGFFVEAGAADFERDSNSLYFELNHGWTGLLVEPHPYLYDKGLLKHRNATSVKVCLSPVKEPSTVPYNPDVEGLVPEGKGVATQCLPLYSLLLAHGNPTVNYFSLDIEGSEFQILKTVPWEKVDIEVMSIETHFVGERSEGSKADLLAYLDSVGYLHIPDAHKVDEDLWFFLDGQDQCRMIINDMFVKKELACKLNLNKCYE